MAKIEIEHGIACACAECEKCKLTIRDWLYKTSGTKYISGIPEDIEKLNRELNKTTKREREKKPWKTFKY